MDVDLVVVHPQEQSSVPMAARPGSVVLPAVVDSTAGVEAVKLFSTISATSMAIRGVPGGGGARVKTGCLAPPGPVVASVDHDVHLAIRVVGDGDAAVEQRRRGAGGAVWPASAGSLRRRSAP